MSVTLPPKAEQQAISEVLCAIDEKISANVAVASRADRLVRAEYRNLAGPLRLRVGDVATSPRDGTDPTMADPSTVYVGLEHMPRRMMWLTERGTAADVASGKFRFANGDILFGRLRPYFHKVVSAPDSGICSTDVLVVRANEDEMAVPLLAAISSDEVIETVVSASEGTRMPRTSWKDLAAIEINWPSDEQATPYSSRLGAIRSSVQSLLAENRTLAALRDALLPGLMSGKLRVRDAEDAVGEVL
jgi:type I restriction enzyme S subunit